MKDWRIVVRWIAVGIILFQLGINWPTPGPGPGPGPNPGPDPPPTPVVEGQRIVVLIRESEDDTPSMAQLIQNLRIGQHADYLESKGHELLILDPDHQDQNGQPLALVQQLKPINSNWPALFILEKSDGRPLHNETLSADATASDVMETIRENGG